MNLSRDRKFWKVIFRRKLINEISKYADYSASECLAEALADYYVNGKTATKLSHEIVKLLKGRF